MKAEIKVPSMGESISEATIGEIFKPSGSQVNMDDELLEIETDKVNQSLFAPSKGKIELSVKKDDKVKIGQVIGTIDTESTQEESPKKESKKQEPKKEEVKKEETKPAESLQEARIPKDRFIEEEKPQEIKVEKPVVKGDRETRKPMSQIRKVTAQRLIQAKQEIAMLTTFNEVDLNEVMAIRERYKESFVKKYGVKLGFMSFFLKATVKALKEIPIVNAYIDQNDIVYRNYYNIGVAVSMEKGLIVPVIRDADKLSFPELEKEIINLADKAKTGKLSVDDLKGGSFTITNGGIFGSLLSTPIVNPPQSAILGMHAIKKRPVVVDDQIVARPMMYLALSYDHRIIDGKEAVTFLVNIKESLEDPSRLLLDL